ELSSVQGIRKEDDNFLVRTAPGNTYRCRTVILTPGKQPRTLGLPDEERLMGRGVSVCSTCDGPLFRERPVAVVGGGNAAIQTAIEMTKIASSVALVTRGIIKCDRIYIDRIKEMGVRIFPHSEVTALHGETTLTGITVRDRKTAKETILDVEGLFLEIGLMPNTQFLKGLVSLNDLGEIIIDENNQTGHPGIFAAGDATCIRGKQIIIAAGEGAKAALAAHEHLLKEGLSCIPIPAAL
ncbi:MAG: FAD-dependent oxidoreductase, partial [Methanomicrobiales archaeon]|nr:FAD-dependent oxidoreductase [Methanomicrobiales archaeon]